MFARRQQMSKKAYRSARSEMIHKARVMADGIRKDMAPLVRKMRDLEPQQLRLCADQLDLAVAYEDIARQLTRLQPPEFPVTTHGQPELSAPREEAQEPTTGQQEITGEGIPVVAKDLARLLAARMSGTITTGEGALYIKAPKGTTREVLARMKALGCEPVRDDDWAKDGCYLHHHGDSANQVDVTLDTELEQIVLHY